MHEITAINATYRKSADDLVGPSIMFIRCGSMYAEKTSVIGKEMS